MRWAQRQQPPSCSNSTNLRWPTRSLLLRLVRLGLVESLGTPANAISTGRAGPRLGLESALFAKVGLTAARTTLEGERGMVHAMSGEPAGSLEAAVATLGTSWRICELSYKAMPTETITQGPLEGSASDAKASRIVRAQAFGV